jgi:hypothetical protein
MNCNSTSNVAYPISAHSHLLFKNKIPILGEPVVLKVTALADSDNPEDKPKGAIQWIPAHAAVPVEVLQ